MSGGSTPTAISEPELVANSADERVPWVVQKYGGTSVGKSLDSITRIVESYIPNNRVAIVCSARSSHTKALGTTNLLLQASREALQPAAASGGTASSPRPSASGWQTPFFPKRVGSGFFNRDQSLMSSVSSLRDLEGSNNNGRSQSPSPFQPSGRSRSPTATSPTGQGPAEVSAGGAETLGESAPFHETVDKIKQGHMEAALATLKAGPLRDELMQEIDNDCENLRSFLFAAQIIDEISPRSQDSIVGTGERLACKIVAAALRDRGVDSELVVLDNIVDAAMHAATEGAVIGSGDQGVAQLDQSFYDELSRRLGERIRECGTRVPVITGYFGPVPGSLLAQIGRGYTDLCAALCAVGLAAAELQVWKEVDGIFTADPRKVPSARLVPSITPDEAAELTYYGSEVIHPFTMEQVIRAKIPIRIKNVENPKGCGTIILPDGEFPVGLDTAAPKKDESSLEDKLPTAVTIKDQIVVLNIHSNRKTISHGFLARIFGTLDRAGVVVDLISTSEVHVSMAMQDFHNKKRLERLVKDLEKIGDITISSDMAILSLVGRNLRNAIGSAGLMFTTLAKASVNIEMISQGASEINISCVIENKDAVRALNVIHDACIEQHGRHLSAPVVPEPQAPAVAVAGAKTGGRSKALSVETINQSVLEVEYAVRGEIAVKADKLEHDIENGNASSLPFDKVVFANIGNPQAKHLDQRPLTYWRQVLSLVEYPDILQNAIAEQLYPSDVIAKASQLLDEFGSVGAYTHSKGSLAIRKRVAQFIKQRDGCEADPESIYLTTGATQGVAMMLGLALRPGDGCLIPIPQYPLYTATLAHVQAQPVPYHLSESAGWALDVSALKQSIATARSNGSIKSLKALVVINPGNPTGSCLTEQQIRDILQIAYDESLLVIADEVYQANIYDHEKRPFVSFKKVLSTMGDKVAQAVELVSFHSISKGMSGECGRRGGYFECVNFDPKVMDMVFKMSSISLCPPVSGQIGVDLLVSPPQPGSPSYDLYASEQKTILDGLRDRSKFMSAAFNALPGISCQPAEGAMYLFPKLDLPNAAKEAAKKAGKDADQFYALELLNATGICAVAGTGFGQEDGTFHLRVTALVPGVEEYTAKIETFHREFMKKYSS